MEADVPLLVPEVNPEHLQVLKQEGRYKGKIIANPNCSTIGLALALKPLDRFGIEQVHVVTMQAVSGAGYPGVASLDVIDNLIPHISGEEEKIESEPLKILGQYDGKQFLSHGAKISAQCNRVPISDGHTECVSIKFKNKPTKEEMIAAWRSFTSEAQAMQLPLAPAHPIHYFEERNYPQPKVHRHLDKGMAVSIGRLRDCPLFDYKFTLFSHNTIRGAAGGALLNGEILVKKGFVYG
jgi:aspartate-semialdehyde dehydrogenase